MKKLVLFAFFALSAAGLSGQPSFDYSDIADGRFAQKSVGGLRSMADGEHYTVVRESAILKYSYATGELVDTLCDVYKHIDAGRSFDGYQLSAGEDKILLELDSRPVYRRSSLSVYAVYDITEGVMTMIDRGNGNIRYAVFSPAGDKVAYVLDNNIYVSNILSDATVQVTYDGESNHIINGIPDWVYEEEFGLSDAMRWSPDGTKIVYLRSDESRVRDYTIDYYAARDADDAQAYAEGNLAAPLYPKRFTYKYPKAGEENSVVSLHVYDLEGGRTAEVNVGPDKDQYVPFFEWTPDGKLYFFRINRMQNHLEVILTDGGKYKVIYEEKSPKYIDDIGLETIHFLSDSKRFIVRNETRTGYSHLYMYSVDKGFMHAITAGNWEVRSVVHADDSNIWFTSNETSPLRSNLYRVNLKGKNKKRLTPLNGTYRIVPSEGCKYYMSYFSNSATPNTVTLHKGDGKLIRTLEDNAALKSYIDSLAMPRKEFFVFTREIEGRKVDFNCYMVRPRDFDPGKKYPLLLTQYSGPGSQEVVDRWRIDWEDALVQEGYIVACIDPRGTGGRGEEFKKLTYGRMGLLETEDQTAFAKELASRPFIDPDRVGIYGWSYGGFMALNCILKGADTFGVAISVAPVTSWRLYDSVYTERVNGMPQTNAAGYDDPSPINHAALLEGKLLLIHGSADDNVHVQNTYKMAYELVRNGKKFDMMIYPDDNHSMMPAGRHNVRQKMVDYCLENL